MKFSLIITALDIREHLLDRSVSKGIVAWCQKRKIKCVYIETYRSKYEVPKDVLVRLRDMFCEADIEALGGICTTDIGKPSTGWPDMSCLTDPAAQEYAEKLFRRAVEVFDTVIIDNRLFADCCCDACDKARDGRCWTDFHRDQTTRLLKDHVIAPTVQANPNVHLIFKFPSWYEGIASRGFDLKGQSGLFPAVVAGGETRDPFSDHWGRRQPYSAYFTVAHFMSATNGKCQASWIDPIACDRDIFVAQVHGSALAGVQELILCSFGQLITLDRAGYTPAEEVLDAVLQERAKLESIEHMVRASGMGGIAAFRPPEGDVRGEPYFFDYLGTLGFPLVPTASFPRDASAAAFCQSSNVGDDFDEKLLTFLESGKLALLTSRLAEELPQTITQHPNASILATHIYTFPDRMPRMVGEELAQDDSLPLAEALYSMSPDELHILRQPFLDILEIDISPSVGITIHQLSGGTCILQNFSGDKWKADVEFERIDKGCSAGVDEAGNLLPGGLMVLQSAKRAQCN